MPTFQYFAYHPLRRNLLARLNVNQPKWTEVVNGNGSFTGKVVIPDDQDVIRVLRAALVPDQSAIYVQSDDGSYVFGGPLVGAAWSRKTREMTITAVSWRSWLYTVYLAPNANGTNRLYTWTNIEQLDIAQQLIDAARGGGLAEGRPFMLGDRRVGQSVSGQTRDLAISGKDFVTIGAAIDRVANRDNGFDWDILSEPNNDGPVARLATWYPYRGSPVIGLRFTDTTNLLETEDYVLDSSDRRTRVWAVGEGASSNATPIAYDADPAIPRGYTLLRETKTQYNSVVNLSTLSSHARAERVYRNPLINLHTVTVGIDSPSWASYGVGDRATLRLKDDWVDITYRNARIVERVFEPMTGSGIVKLTFDLGGLTLPYTGDE